MTSFWDASAIIPILVPEPNSRELRNRFVGARTTFTWWGTCVECISALSRRQRGGLAARTVDAAIAGLAEMRAAWVEIAPLEEVRESALRLVRTHSLSAADALQLAAALYAAEGRPSTLEFVCLDQRLLAAARLEGFAVVAPGSGNRA